MIALMLAQLHRNWRIPKRAWSRMLAELMSALHDLSRYVPQF